MSGWEGVRNLILKKTDKFAGFYTGHCNSQIHIYHIYKCTYTHNVTRDTDMCHCLCNACGRTMKKGQAHTHTTSLAGSSCSDLHVMMG